MAELGSSLRAHMISPYDKVDAQGNVKIMWRYEVKGNAEDLADYIESQGTFIRWADPETKTRPLMFTDRFYGLPVNKLYKRKSDGQYILDSTAIKAVQSTVKHSGEFVANYLMGSLLNTASQQASTPQASASDEEVNDVEDDV